MMDQLATNDKSQVQVIARGAGTGLSGGALPLAALVLLCTTPLASAVAKPWMIVGNDEKLVWDADGKPILSAAGKDSVGIAGLYNEETGEPADLIEILGEDAPHTAVLACPIEGPRGGYGLLYLSSGPGADVFSPGERSQTNLRTDGGQFKTLSKAYLAKPAPLP